VLGYTLRRLLLMIPTFIGILLINFVVLRLQSDSLTEAMQQQAGKEGGGTGDSKGGSRRSETTFTALENHLARFRRTGNDRPALINLRGFLDKDDIVAQLEAGLRKPGAIESRRSKAETGLWLTGWFAVAPLAEVLADDALVHLHGPASIAFTLCAYRALNVEDLSTLTPAEQERIQRRNFELRKLRFPDGAADPAYALKRQALLDLFARDGEDFAHSAGRAWSAIVIDTGFTDFMVKLFTLRLYSETRGEYVFTVIGDRWQVTFWLNFISIIIAWAGSVLIGIRSARRIGTLEDRATTNVLFLLWSVPSFFIGTLMLHHLCTDTVGGKAWFPNRGLSSDDSLWYTTPRYLMDLAWHGFLPLLVLSYGSFTSLSRYMRGNLLEQLQSDYIRSARAKGASEDAVVYRHAVPNSMITMITLGAGLLAELFGGFVFVEYIFSIPGLGTLLLEAAKQQDGPLLMGSTVISVGLLLIGILVTDLLYAVIDPRIRAKYA
jgi:peptide/nickel transport system permease protein